MLILNLPVTENLVKAEYALGQADSSNIIELCRNYLQVLSDYRKELFELRGKPEIMLSNASLPEREFTEQVRKTVRAAIENTTKERNKIESLLKSFIAINGYEAVETFNSVIFRGFDNWKLRANSITTGNGESDGQMSMQEAVEAASMLRREAYIDRKISFSKQVSSGLQIIKLGTKQI